jgi:hypothetical protein
MWLLDVNLPTALVHALGADGVQCETAADRGWRELTNGRLVSEAYHAGFRVLLTRDRLFGGAARKSLSGLPEMAIVVLTLPQARGAAYVSAFVKRWRERPIQPKPGLVIEWP